MQLQWMEMLHAWITFVKKGRKDGDDNELTRIMLQESFHSLLNLLKGVLMLFAMKSESPSTINMQDGK